jgi:hypothetical protein
MVKGRMRAETSHVTRGPCPTPRSRVVKSWLVSLLRAWREDWRSMREVTKVIVLLLGLVFLAWGAYMLLFAMTFEI